MSELHLVKPGFHYQSWRVTGFHYPSTHVSTSRVDDTSTQVVEIGLNQSPLQFVWLHQHHYQHTNTTAQSWVHTVHLQHEWNNAHNQNHSLPCHFTSVFYCCCWLGNFSKDIQTDTSSTPVTIHARLLVWLYIRRIHLFVCLYISSIITCVFYSKCNFFSNSKLISLNLLPHDLCIQSFKFRHFVGMQKSCAIKCVINQ